MKPKKTKCCVCREIKSKSKLFDCGHKWNDECYRVLCKEHKRQRNIKYIEFNLFQGMAFIDKAKKYLKDIYDSPKKPKAGK